MQINISTRHGQLSAATQEKISEKVSKLTRFHDRLSLAVVTVSLNGEEGAAVEIQITAERAGKFVASDNSGNLMTSLDAALHKVEQQLKKHKDKFTNRRTSGRRVSVETETGPTAAGEGVVEED